MDGKNGKSDALKMMKIRCIDMFILKLKLILYVKFDLILHSIAQKKPKTTMPVVNHRQTMDRKPLLGLCLT